MPAGRVCFRLPGQGFQKLGTGAQAYREDDAFRAAFDRVAAATLAAGGADLRRFLAIPADPAAAEALQAELDDQRQAGAFTLATSWAMAEQRQARGVRPDVVLGQSTGELCAAALTGVLSIEDAVRLTMARAELLDRTEPGAVLAVARGADALEPLLPNGAWVALRNGPEATVCAGRPAAIAALQATMQARGVVTREVRVSIAAHTPLLEPVAAPLTAFAASVPLQAPSAVLWSCVTGRPLDADAARDPLHWARLTIAPVDLQAALRALDADSNAAWIELGPGAACPRRCAGMPPAAAHARRCRSPSAPRRRPPSKPSSPWSRSCSASPGSAPTTTSSPSAAIRWSRCAWSRPSAAATASSSPRARPSAA